jgi:hypothetical protein
MLIVKQAWLRMCCVSPHLSTHGHVICQVLELQERLLSDLAEMKSTFGADSMIVSLALSQASVLLEEICGR